MTGRFVSSKFKTDSSEPVPCHGNVWQNGDTYRNWLKKDVMAGTQSPECAKAVYDNMNISF